MTDDSKREDNQISSKGEVNKADNGGEEIGAPPQIVAPDIANKDSASSKITLAVLIGCVLASAVGLIFFMNKEPEAGVMVAPKNAVEGQGNLIDGREYMIYMQKLEVAPLNGEGKAWDVQASAPDLYYEVMWQENKIYTSDTKNDSLIANWIPIGFDLKDSILKGKVSVDQAVTIPIVRRDSAHGSSGELVIRVLDDDVTNDDVIEELKIDMSKLNVGNNNFDFNGVPGHNIVRAIIRVIDNSLSTNEKIELLMGGG